MSAAVSPAVRFHLSLNVSNLPEAVAFFERVLGVAPAKQRSDYAKFELDNPPLVFSLEPRSPQEHGSFNHAGFRFADAASLVEAQKRLAEAGISTQREEGVECCYAKQTKFWVHDLDKRLWEFYVLDGDLEHRGQGQALEQMTVLDQAPVSCNLPVTWEHRMGSPFEIPAGTFDDIRLRGTFNVPVTQEWIGQALQEVSDRLKPGGKVQLHMLTCEEPLAGEPQLPGPAAYVKHVPVRGELMQALESAGFTDLQLTTFRSGACFESEGQPLRETRIEARKPVAVSDESCVVVFKGPFKQVTDDDGNCWQRGEPTLVPRSRWEALRTSSLADLFVELPQLAAVSHCGG